MKKMLLKFADNLLSREQMKEVKGGTLCNRTCSWGYALVNGRLTMVQDCWDVMYQSCSQCLNTYGGNSNFAGCA